MNRAHVGLPGRNKHEERSTFLMLGIVNLKRQPTSMTLRQTNEPCRFMFASKPEIELKCTSRTNMHAGLEDLITASDWGIDIINIKVEH